MQLPIKKAGGSLSLPLVKNERYRVEVTWDGKHDVDIHALLCFRDTLESTAKAYSLDDVLSTYNVERRISGQGLVGTLKLKADGSFDIYNGALVHSPDETTGDNHTKEDDPDEYIDIFPNKLPSPFEMKVAAIEIPIVATIHDERGQLRFKHVENVVVTIWDGNNHKIYSNKLSDTFKDCAGVQLGTIIITDKETKFYDINTGFQSSFNDVLNHFS